MRAAVHYDAICHDVVWRNLPRLRSQLPPRAPQRHLRQCCPPQQCLSLYRQPRCRPHRCCPTQRCQPLLFVTAPPAATPSAGTPFVALPPATMLLAATPTRPTRPPAALRLHGRRPLEERAGGSRNGCVVLAEGAKVMNSRAQSVKV